MEAFKQWDRGENTPRASGLHRDSMPRDRSAGLKLMLCSVLPPRNSVRK